ncbi:hypothetical protein BGZ83_010142 [Gryganskiella cystojenkinii]|nr:hypothetical protein BGZ83_010142 [Gryganskiella cystojenkinii]
MTFPQPYSDSYNDYNDHHGAASVNHPELGPWTPLDLVHCSNRKLDIEYFSSRSFSIHRRIVIRNFLSILYQLQPLNDHDNFNSNRLQLNLHTPPSFSNCQDHPEVHDDNYNYDHQEPGQDQWMEQTLSAAGFTSSGSYDNTATQVAASVPSNSGHDDLDSPMLKWINSSSEPILSRAAAAAASAVTSRRRPQSLRSSRIPLPRPQSTELPQSLHSYLSTVFDVDWSIKVPTTEDALFTNKTSASRLSRTSETMSYTLSNLSLSSSPSSPLPSPSPSVDTTEIASSFVKSEPSPALAFSTTFTSSTSPSSPTSSSTSSSSALSSSPSQSDAVRHGHMQEARIGLQGRSSSSLNQTYQEGNSVGLHESKSSSEQNHAGVATTKTPLSSWEQHALQRQSTLKNRDPQQPQQQQQQQPYRRQEDLHQHSYHHEQQQQPEQHIHNHIHIHVHTYAPPSDKEFDNTSLVKSYSPTPQTRSSRYPTQALPTPPQAIIQQKYQHHNQPYPSIAVAGPLAPYSSPQPFTASSQSSSGSYDQYPPEKAPTAEQDQPYIAVSPLSPPPPSLSPSRSRYPRSPPPPPYTPSTSATLANDIAEIADSLLYPRSMKQIQGPPMAPRHLQSAAARKEYQRYEEQQRIFKRDDETKEAESQGFLRLLTRQSSKRKPSVSTISISAPIPVFQQVQWQDHPEQQNRRNSRSLPSTSSSAKSTVNSLLKSTFSSGKAGRSSRVSLPIVPLSPPPSASVESSPCYPPRSHQAPFTLSISAAQS